MVSRAEPVVVVIKMVTLTPKVLVAEFSTRSNAQITDASFSKVLDFVSFGEILFFMPEFPLPFFGCAFLFSGKL